jgi:hypothetical protein
VGWREHQGAAVAFGVEHGGRGDADGRLAAAHLAIDDRGTFAAVEEQLGGGMDHIGLRGEKLALEAREDDLPMRTGLTAIDRRIGAVERIEQLVAELRYEVLQAEREGGSDRFEQVALHSRFGNGFKIEGHGDAPEQWGMYLPHGAMACPEVGRM